MELAAAKKIAELLLRLAGKNPQVAALPMRVQKPPYPKAGKPSTPLPRSIPERAGVRSEYLKAFLQEAAESRDNLHSLTVLRHGRVILSCSLEPYDQRVWHVTHSLCKSITALAVGILIGDGRLSLQERVTDLFSTKVNDAARARYRRLTVRHLLTMTSGVSFNEARSVTDMDWVRGFLESAPLFEPGSAFQYNSMNTYMLSAIVCAKTGRTLTEFIRERLFAPMGIHRFHWETCPLGIEKGGWGLYLLQEDAAKLGQLLLQKGKWDGSQLVPEDYVREMCSKQSEPPVEMGEYGYGYQCWLWARPGSVQFSGLFGQNVLVIPDLDMVIASNAGGNKLFGKSEFLRCCEKYFGPEVSLPDTLLPDPVGQFWLQKELYTLQTGRKLRDTLTLLSARRQRQWVETRNRDVSGKRYRFEPGAVRLLPLFVQLLENNYTVGITEIAFAYENTLLYLEIQEGEERNRIPVGFEKAARAEIKANGEEQIVAVRGEWSEDGDRVPVLSVKLAFLEQASTRFLRFRFESEERVCVRFSEMPSGQALTEGAETLLGGNRLFKMLSGENGDGRLQTWIHDLAEPEVTGERTK